MSRHEVIARIQVTDMKINELKRTLESLKTNCESHSETLSENEDHNEHKYAASCEATDRLLESISDFETYGLDNIRNLKS